MFKLAGMDWSLLSSPSYTYTHCFSFIGAKIYTNEKKSIIFFHTVPDICYTFVLEVLMSSFERYLS